MQFSSRSDATLRLQLFLILTLLLASCSTVAPNPLPGDTPQPPGGTPPPQASTEPARSPTPTPPASLAVGPQTLVLWLPPQFDPSGTSPGAVKLQARLNAFQAANTDLKIEVRIKALNGPGGLLDSLSATNTAAPVNLPGLIALSRTDLETAALKGLVYPLDTLSTLANDPDWYAYAHQLAFIQGSPYGLPFAGDALILMYRSIQAPVPPADWPALFKYNLPLAFPAADPQGMLTLLLYLSAGGTIKDSQGRPGLQAEVLTKVLKLYVDGAKAGTFSIGLAQFQTDGQAAQAYNELPPQTQWLVSWSSRFLHEMPADTVVGSLPSLGKQPYTLATGWVWALSEPNPDRRAAAVRLAEFLVGSDFLSQWTAAEGYLPTRPSALAGWSNQSLKSILSPIVLAAQVRPSNDLMSVLGPVLQDATMQILKQQADPAQVAQAAAERLTIPPSK